MGSGLARRHLEDAGYRRRTIAFALKNVTDTYQPSDAGHVRHGSSSAPHPAAPVEPCALADVEAIWQRWMAGGDLYPLHVALGTYAANCLPGDPVWSMLVGGSGSGKTEAVQSLARLPDVRLASTISGEAALLSATPRRERSNGSTGGLLRAIGDHGVLALKDFTTILATHRDRRGEILAALREVYDGEWHREVGAEGGRSLHWKGKVGCVTGCTTAIDTAYAVVAALGTRFLLARMPVVDRRQQARQSMVQAGREGEMRQQLAAAVAGLFAEGPPRPPAELTEEVVAPLVEVSNLVALARSPVERDARHEIELVPDPEAPTRLAKALAMLYRGLTSVGLVSEDARNLVLRVGLDCVPKLRRLILLALVNADNPTTSEIAGLVDHPTITTRRALEDLAAHGVVVRTPAAKRGLSDRWSLPPSWRELVGGLSVSSGCRHSSASCNSSSCTQHPEEDETDKPPSANSAPSSNEDFSEGAFGDAPDLGRCPLCGTPLAAPAGDPGCPGCDAGDPWCPGCRAHVETG